jgi:hypothetical protein
MGTADASAASTGLRQAIKKHPLFFYFFMAYAITWILLIPYTLSAWGIISGDWTVRSLE